MLGLTIGDKHTYRDWGLMWLEPYTIEYPEPKLNTIDIPGSDGVLDISEALVGRVLYGQRNAEFTFESSDQDYFDFEVVKSKVANYLHGKQHRIISDLDPSYYYTGRLKFNAEKSSKSESTIVLSGELQPYKLEVCSSTDPWLWSIFSFKEGVIKDFKSRPVSGELIVVIPPIFRPCIPTFTATSDMTVELEGRVYELKSGVSQQIPYITFFDKESSLVFRGNGEVTIDYRGGRL